MTRVPPSFLLPSTIVVLLAVAMAGAQSTSSPGGTKPSPVDGQQQSGATVPAPAAPEAQAQPEMPVTTRFPDESAAAEVDALLNPPELPKEKVTLIGGTVRNIDRIRNRVDVNVFGGKKIRFEFDERTRIFRDGTEVTSIGVNDGDRIYVDSQLDENRRIFARNIHIVTNLVPAEATGQITAFNARTGRMTLNDQLSSRPVTLLVTNETRITDSRGVAAADKKQLLPGALVEVGFGPAKGARGRRAIAEQVKLIAAINSEHFFEGPITHVDMRSGMLAIRNQRDNRIYDLRFDSSLASHSEIRIGMKVTAKARYTGEQYQVTEMRLHEESRADTDKEKEGKPDANKDDEEE
jgi:hypothetical protein